VHGPLLRWQAGARKGKHLQPHDYRSGNKRSPAKIAIITPISPSLSSPSAAFVKVVMQFRKLKSWLSRKPKKELGSDAQRGAAASPPLHFPSTSLTVTTEAQVSEPPNTSYIPASIDLESPEQDSGEGLSGGSENESNIWWRIPTCFRGQERPTCYKEGSAEGLARSLMFYNASCSTTDQFISIHGNGQLCCSRIPAFPPRTWNSKGLLK
jgi:hypothetical protein